MVNKVSIHAKLPINRQKPIKKRGKTFRFFLYVVAGVGFEPHDLRVMSPTSYRLLYPALLDCKYTDIF